MECGFCDICYENHQCAVECHVRPRLERKYGFPSNCGDRSRPRLPANCTREELETDIRVCKNSIIRAKLQSWREGLGNYTFDTHDCHSYNIYSSCHNDCHSSNIYCQRLSPLRRLPLLQSQPLLPFLCLPTTFPPHRTRKLVETGNLPLCQFLWVCTIRKSTTAIAQFAPGDLKSLAKHVNEFHFDVDESNPRVAAWLDVG